MYAILETGGKQYRVQPGDTIHVERLPAEPGETLELGSVLLLAGDGEPARVGTPNVPGAVVQAEVLEHARGDKIIVFRYKSKVRYRRKTGHRQALTRLRITDILVDGQSTARQPAGVAEDAQEAPTRRRRAAAAAVVKPEEPEVAPDAPVAEPSADAPSPEAEE
jgi:large subunit ribosomal protein L21